MPVPNASLQQTAFPGNNGSLIEIMTFLMQRKTIQEGNGSGNFREINSNDFQDGNWEPMEMKGSLRMPRR